MVGSSPRAKAILSSEAISSAASPTNSWCISSKNSTTRPRDCATSFLIAPSRAASAPRTPRAGDELGDRDLNDDLVVERRGVLRLRDALSEPADHAGLADARDTHEHRTIAFTLRQHVERLLDLRLASDHGIELALGGRERQVLSERRQHRVALWIELEALGARRAGGASVGATAKGDGADGPWGSTGAGGSTGGAAAATAGLRSVMIGTAVAVEGRRGGGGDGSGAAGAAEAALPFARSVSGEPRDPAPPGARRCEGGPRPSRTARAGAEPPRAARSRAPPTNDRTKPWSPPSSPRPDARARAPAGWPARRRRSAPGHSEGCRRSSNAALRAEPRLHFGRAAIAAEQVRARDSLPPPVRELLGELAEGVELGLDSGVRHQDSFCPPA